VFVISLLEGGYSAVLAEGRLRYAAF
jgi:hypothetical protein